MKPQSSQLLFKWNLSFTTQRKLTILLILILFLVTLFWWYQDNTPIKRVKPSNTEIAMQSKQINYFFEHTTVSQYDVNGRLSYHFFSPKVTYHTDGTALAESPYLIDYKSENNETVAQANSGKWWSNTKKLELRGAVSITQTNLKNTEWVRIDTEYITLDIQEGIAETDQPVSITKNQGKITAVGMKAYYNSHEIHLLSNVKGSHEVE